MKIRIFPQQNLNIRDRDLDIFSVKSFGCIILIGVGFLGFYFEPKNDGSCKKSKQNTKTEYQKNSYSMKMLHFSNTSIPTRTLMSFPGTYF